jgi:hypothetical protein
VDFLKKVSTKCSTDMLHEFALSPAIFRADSYESSLVADLCLKGIGPSLLDDCIVRNLHDGSWLRSILEGSACPHPKAKELINKLNKQGRLADFKAMQAVCPEAEVEWENEAVSTHHESRLSGIIVTEDSKRTRHPRNKFVECPEKLANADFWKNRPCSLRIPRDIEAYSKLLDPVLRHANFIAFIDPHLDPSQSHYKDFIQIITHQALRNRDPKPTIEIHRVATLGSGPAKVIAIDELKKRFRDNWEAAMKDNNIKANIFLWDDFHDRFVASNLLSMSWSNGFDTTTSSSAKVTVSRLSREDRRDLQDEFTYNSTQHKRLDHFYIGDR